MADEELRRLELAVARGGVAERLRFASALERAGRRDEALGVLLPARHDAQVRRELGRWPAWNGGRGGRPEHSFVDVAPIRAKPRIRWQRETLAVERWESRQPFLASPLAVVCPVAADRVGVIDPEDGRSRFEVTIREPGSVSAAIHGDVLLLNHAPGERLVLEAWDLWTGDLLWETTEIQPVWLSPTARYLVEGAGETIVLHELDDPRSPPVRKWRALVGRAKRLASGRDVVVETDDGLLMLDRGTGERRWVAPGERLVAVDEHGVVMARGDRPIVTALSRELVLAVDGSPPEVVLRRRADGDVLVRLGRLADYGAVAIARDMLYLQYWLIVGSAPDLSLVFGIRAFDTSGGLVFSVPREELGDTIGLAAAPGTLYALSVNGTLTCLEEPT